MVNFKKIKLFGAVTAAVTLLAGAAWAGPTWTFGPEDQGLLKLEYKGQFQLNVRDDGAEADGDGTATEFNFRRNRIALIGAYGANFGLYVQTEFMEDNNINTLGVSDGDNKDFQILDAQFRFKYNDAVQLTLGKLKYNLTRENLEACEAPLTLDRSLFIRPSLVDSTRDKGVVLWGNLFEQKFQYRLEAMNGRNDSASAPTSNLRYAARAHVSLLDPESGYGYKGTYLGEKKVLTVGASYAFEKDVAYADAANQTDAVDFKAWSVDLYFEYPVEGMGTFTFSTAYLDCDLDDAYQGADPEADVMGLNGEKNGGYTKIGYLLPNLPLQLFARAENWSFAELDGVYDQELDWYAFGCNYYFRDQNLKATLQIADTDFDDETQNDDFMTYTAQLQVLF